MISEFALFFFTLAGGTAAGAYVLAPFVEQRQYKDLRRAAMPAVALVLLAIGGVSLLLHLGHPERMLFAFSKPWAGIAAEGYTTVFFGIMVVIDLVLRVVRGASNKVVTWLCALGGLLVCCAMAYAYHSYTNVGAWHAFSTLPLFVLGNLSAGGALCGVFAKDGVAGKRYNTALLVVQVLALASFVLAAATFAATGANAGMAVAGAIVGPVACLVLAVVARSGRKLPGAAAIMVVLAVVGLALVRYAFYAVV